MGSARRDVDRCYGTLQWPLLPDDTNRRAALSATTGFTVESEGKEMMADRQSTLAPFFGPDGASSWGPTSNPDDRQIAQRRQRFRAIIPFITTKGVPTRRRSFRPVVPRRDKLRRFGAVRVDFRELQEGERGTSRVPPKCSISA